jgi:CheY-like chemotaxis protein
MSADRSVLIVDDDADIRESIGGALEDEGYRVAGASNGKEALRLLKAASPRPGLILLDMMMPEMDGWAFRAEQRKDPELAGIPVLVFTAYGSPKDVARQLQAAGFVRKPLRLEELLSSVARAHKAEGAS